MTEFSIYQINTNRDDNRVCFLGLDTLERFQHSKAVDSSLYDRVYDGKLDCKSLEAIYEKFNIDHPDDYTGRSLSVSDVVEIKESDTFNPGFYFVDSIGFKAISFDKSLCKEPVRDTAGKLSVLLVEPNQYPKILRSTTRWRQCRQSLAVTSRNICPSRMRSPSSAMRRARCRDFRPTVPFTVSRNR